MSWQLLKTTFGGKKDEFRKLIANGANLNAANESPYDLESEIRIYKDDETPLYVAASEGHVDAMRVLLDKGAKVDTPMSDGFTPLYVAASEGHVDVMRLLLDKGAKVDTPMSDGITPLFVAASEGHVDAMRLLLDKGAKVDTPNKNDGATPLYVVAQNGHVDAMRLLLDKGAKVDTPRNDGATPLYVAAYRGHVDAMRLLLDKGAKVDTPKNDGFTPLVVAAQNGHVDAMRVLLDKGAKVDTPKNDGATPLYVAAYRGHVDAMRLLLDKGAKVDTSNKDGATPLYIAASKGHVDAMRLLLDKGAKVDTPDHDGWTPLMIAASENHVDAVRLLITNGANAGRKVNEKTARNYASDQGNHDIIQLLDNWMLEYGFLDELFANVSLSGAEKFKYKTILKDQGFTTDRAITRLDIAWLERLGIRPGHAIEIEEAIKARSKSSASVTAVAVTSPSAKDSLQSSYIAFFSYAQADAVSETSLFYRKAIERFPATAIFHDANTRFALTELIDRVKRSKNVIVMLSFMYPRRPWAMIELHHALRSGCKVTAVRLLKPTPPMFDFDAVYADINGGNIDSYMKKEEWKIVENAGITKVDVMSNLKKVMDAVAVDFSSKASIGVQDAMVKDVLDSLQY